MSFTTTRAERRELERHNAKLPVALQEIPKADWPITANTDSTRLRAWRSRHWLVQEFSAPAPAVVRLSVNRTTVTDGRWEDGISWDELQAIKREIGYGAQQAVEIYPADRDVVNVANMRHLWILAEPLAFAWKGRP